MTEPTELGLTTVPIISASDKFYQSLSVAYRKFSVQWDLLWTAFLVYYFALPPKCTVEALAVKACEMSQADLLAHLPVPAWVIPILLGFLPRLFLVSTPQASMPTSIASNSKSLD